MRRTTAWMRASITQMCSNTKYLAGSLSALGPVKSRVQGFYREETPDAKRKGSV